MGILLGYNVLTFLFTTNHVWICKKEKKNDGRRQKTFHPCNHVLETAIAPPQKKNYAQLFYLQNGYLYFCSNQTILEIKGVSI